MPSVYDNVADLPADFLAGCAERPLPAAVLMCPPDAFDVIDVKNPFMEGQIGRVDVERARLQWDDVRRAFEACGARVELIPPADELEDMVFCANQTLVGLDDSGQPLCVLSNMKFPSRQSEVPHFAEWFAACDYAVEHLTGDEVFEGGGDAIWHPGRGLIWGGYGPRTEPEAYDAISDFFGVPVLRICLISDWFYHLDAALCAIDERIALIHSPAMAPESAELMRAVFTDVIEVDDAEARQLMACNAAAIGGQHIIIHARCHRTIAALRERGYTVHPVDTSEFIKSGGSVYCLKAYLV